MNIRRFCNQVIMLMCIALSANAADFDWTANFNLRASNQGSEFITRISRTLGITEAQFSLAIDRTGSFADAYIVFKLANMSDRPVNEVTDLYQRQQGQGWGALAQSLGIKPGSRQFKRLKKGRNLPLFDTGSESDK